MHQRLAAEMARQQRAFRGLDARGGKVAIKWLIRLAEIVAGERCLRGDAEFLENSLQLLALGVVGGTKPA